MESSTIDLNRELTPKEIARAEDEANRIVWEDRDVRIRLVEAAEAASLGLRKESKREGTLRLIEIDDFDLSACGGTHVSRTGAIGIIVVPATERFRGGSRVTFQCGARALAGYRALRDVADQSGRILSVGAAELPVAVERLQAEGKDLRKRIKDFQNTLASHEGDTLADASTAVGAVRLALAALPGWDANGLKTIASRIVERPGHAAVLVGGPPPAPIVVARAADVPLDSGAVLRTLVERHGGKGGGRPELAQGGGITAAPADVVQSARTLIAELLKT
jgi:alanyl-tRNA synthetase